MYVERNKKIVFNQIGAAWDRMIDTAREIEKETRYTEKI
jgi:hypothetical protein